MKTTALGVLATAFALLLGAAGGRAQAPASPAAATATAVLHADRPGPVVNKNIYGHLFAQDRASILKAMNQAVTRLYVEDDSGEQAA